MDRLTIINDALLETGNNPLNFEYDGSPEWQAADSAYRRSVQYLISKHRWNFATTTVDLAGLLPKSPSALEHYNKAYALPADCLHVAGVYLNGYPLTQYEIVDHRVCCAYDAGVSVKYVRTPSPDQWPPMFIELLTMKVEAHLLRGLNEDTANAERRDARVDAELAEFRSQSDQEEGRRVILRSRTAARRRGLASRAPRFPYGS
ncbi:hypothetical protein DC522_05925 [Microvirga sp. KLBC 81]|nr:hypothetical protein DC522_05925 [Microvirga sp. KLBC 81]